MINEIVIAGVVKKVYDMTENIILAQIECNDELFFIYWLNNEFDIGNILDKYVIVKGNLTNVRVKKSDNATRITAICAKGIEKYDF